MVSLTVVARSSSSAHSFIATCTKGRTSVSFCSCSLDWDIEVIDDSADNSCDFPQVFLGDALGEDVCRGDAFGEVPFGGFTSSKGTLHEKTLGEGVIGELSRDTPFLT